MNVQHGPFQKNIGFKRSCLWWATLWYLSEVFYLPLSWDLSPSLSLASRRPCYYCPCSYQLSDCPRPPPSLFWQCHEQPLRQTYGFQLWWHHRLGGKGKMWEAYSKIRLQHTKAEVSKHRCLIDGVCEVEVSLLFSFLVEWLVMRCLVYTLNNLNLSSSGNLVQAGPMNANNLEQFSKQWYDSLTAMTAIHVKGREIYVQHLKTRVLRILFPLLTWGHHRCTPQLQYTVDDRNPDHQNIKLLKFIPRFIPSNQDFGHQQYFPYSLHILKTVRQILGRMLLFSRAR